jgi:putative transcriptional regulator
MSAAATTKKPAEAQDWTRFDAMTDEQRHAAALADPDAQPWTEEQLANAKRRPRTVTIRRAMKLSLADFAELAGVTVETLKAWEDGLAPDKRARARLEEIALAAALRQRGERGPQRTPTKRLLSIRLDADLVEHYRATGAGWQSRINEDLRKAAKLKEPA